MTSLSGSQDLRERIGAILAQPLEQHGELFAEINEELTVQLKEIESA
jgi:hypothetical protein